MNEEEKHEQNGKCIVVSDVHLGTEYSNREEFINFIDDLEDDVERLVLLGDIFDFWRRDPVGVLLENFDIVHKLLSLEPRTNVFFVVGNHDFHLIKFPKSYFGLKLDLNYDLSLEYGKTKYRFIHGHQLENQTYPGEFLIYGHTHEPFVKMEKKIANTGSWVKPSATYLEIDAERVTLKSVV